MTELNELSESQINDVNAIIETLQYDIALVNDNIERRKFDEALKNILEGMKHTTCPICKEKFANLSVKVIESKKSCDSNADKCELLIQEALNTARYMKEEFIPIATTKKAIKDINNIESTNILNPIKAPLKLIDKLLNV